jgi:iron complex transport system substrate-binding protein
MSMVRVTALLIVLGALFNDGPAHGKSLIDLAGRHVEVPDHVERVIVGEGRFIPALAILDKDDPIKRVVGQLGEWKRTDPAGYEKYLERFPHLSKVPLIGQTSSDTFNIEAAISLRPDVAIFGIEGHGPSSRDAETIRRLEAAGIAIVFIDFRQEPLLNTPKSVKLLGQLLGREKEADEFARFYDEQVNIITTRLADSSNRKPTVFLESRIGFNDECCRTMVHGMMGRLVDSAGGMNIGNDRIPGVAGNLSIEYLLSVQPDVYIGTAIGASRSAKSGSFRVTLGAGVSKESARASLRHALTRTGFAELNAVGNRRAFAIWHSFYDSPFNVAALQAIAKWLHPRLFADIDPDQTLQTLYARFQPVPLSGIYWIGLE